jgi:hypothetical protein
MIGDKFNMPKEDQLRRVRSQGEWWLPNKRVDAIAAYAVKEKPERAKMSKVGAVADYLYEAQRAAIRKSEASQ